MAFVDLRRILLDVLPSPAMIVQGRELRIQNHLAMICDHLWAINAVMMDAEIRALKERDLEDWMVDVGAAIADLEVLLDGILDSALMREATATSNHLSRSFPGNRVAFRLATLRKLKKMVRWLNDLIRRGSELNLRKEMMNAKDPRREDYSTILRDEVVGRDKDRDNIIEILQQQRLQYSCGDSHDVRSFVVIHGYQGMGKTTLARMIFHHPWVRQHFHHCIWVDVSKHLFCLDFPTIARECVESITEESSGHLQHPYLQLQEGLGKSRYFLVLDNFSSWSSSGLEYNWDPFKHILLHVGGPGSTVIITSKESVKYIVRPEESSVVKFYKLKGLSEDDWMKLFTRHARVIQPDRQLSTWAEELFRRRDGEPWAAKVFGSILGYTEVSRWQQLVHIFHYTSGIDDSKIRWHKCGALLFLHDLPIGHARLSLYLSSFPTIPPDQQDYDTEDFMHMMIVEGLIPHECDRKNVEGRFLETPAWYEEQRVTSPYHFMMIVGQDSQIPRQCRHLCLLFNSTDSNASTFPMALSAGAQKNLKTLILHRMKEEEMVLKVQRCQIAKIPKAMFANLLNLRILNLRDSSIQELPSTVGKLHNLRYLNLSRADIETLPGSFCNLGNLQILNLSHCEKLQKLPRRIHKLRKLQILKLGYCEKLRTLSESVAALENLLELDLEGCHWLDQLPEGFGNMKRLTDLNMHKCVSLTRMPRGIGQFISLRKLSGFVVDDDLGSITQQELQTLVNLEGLRLRGLERLSNFEDIRNIKLQEKPKLKNLALHWKWWNMSDDDEEAILVNSQQQALEGLQPKSTLEKLEIVSYPGQILPTWMTRREFYVMSLVEIRLINIKRCEALPPLGQLRNLEIVEISGMDSISIVDDTFCGDTDYAFSYLTKVTFSEMPALEKWTMGKRKGNKVSISLGELTLIQCPKFKALEVHFYTIRRLNIWLNNNEMLLTSNFMGWHNFGSSTWELEIIGCQDLRCLPEGIWNLGHVRHLTIIGCRRLTSLSDGSNELKYLESLYISGCSGLSSIPEGLKKRLGNKLRVEGCPKLQL